MRIIAGQKRGLRLLSPKGDVSRPITDRVKESVFSVLYKYDIPVDMTVADVFSGVGSIGLEALSRGAKFCTFIEKDSRVVAVLEKNIAKAGFVKESKVIRTNAFKSGAPVVEEKYQFVSIDPPFPLTKDVSETSQFADMLEVLQSQLAPDAIVIIRTHKCVDLLEKYGFLKQIDRRKWGINAVAIFQYDIR
ncbi:MAG TPA: RsmD family RNA methyltransferase [Sedimentisphaerales bacterium]|nr:RsmD family RNA methyltransferase [Sedimentisphaerales bacterium]